MKVSLYLTTDTLIAANQLLQRLYELPVFPSTTKNVYKSIGFDIADKFDSKTKTVIKKGNVSKNDKIKISMKFHEAWALEKIINSMDMTSNNAYSKMLLRQFSAMLNQKIV